MDKEEKREKRDALAPHAATVNEDQLQLGKKRQVWFIPLADE